MWTQVEKAKVRLAVSQASRVQRAIKRSVNVEKIIEEFFQAHPQSNITPEQARSWAEDNVHFDKEPLSNLYPMLYAEGWAFGQDVARSALVNAKVNKALFTIDEMKSAQAVNWSDWKPGQKAAAQLLHPPVGLHRLMASRGIALQGIGKTTTDRIGMVLATAINEGLSPQSAVISITQPIRDEIARNMKVGIEEVLSDPIRALMIAQTEMARAVSIASRSQYENSSVEFVEWLVAEGCDICVENADASPIRISDTFPSGDSEPPAHPNCMCSLSPYVVDTRGIGESALDDSFNVE